MEDASHGELQGIVVGINGFEVVCAASRAKGLGSGEERFDRFVAETLRGKHIVCRIGHTRRYEPLASGLRAMTALVEPVFPVAGSAPRAGCAIRIRHWL